MEVRHTNDSQGKQKENPLGFILGDGSLALNAYNRGRDWPLGQWDNANVWRRLHTRGGKLNKTTRMSLLGKNFSNITLLWKPPFELGGMHQFIVNLGQSLPK